MRKRSSVWPASRRSISAYSPRLAAALSLVWRWWGVSKLESEWAEASRRLFPAQAAEARRRERATHFELDRVKNRRWIDVQCSEVLRRAEALGVPRLLPASHMCFRIRRDGY